MSLRGPIHRPMPHDKYYTHPKYVEPLIANLPPLPSNMSVLEPAAGAGHLAMALAHHFPGRVSATDLHPAKRQVFPVRGPIPFESFTGQPKIPQFIATNPPYGRASKMAIMFIERACWMVEPQEGLVAMLLPFEFDAARSRLPLVGGHPAFAFKLTIGERIRWVNLPQSVNAPMGHHAWFVWDFNKARCARVRAQGQLRVA